MMLSCDQCNTNFERRWSLGSDAGDHCCTMLCKTLAMKVGGKINKQFVKNCNEKWGTDYPLQNDDLKLAAKETCIERYGVDNVLKLAVNNVERQVFVFKWPIDLL